MELYTIVLPKYRISANGRVEKTIVEKVTAQQLNTLLVGLTVLCLGNYNSNKPVLRTVLFNTHKFRFIDDFV